MHFRTEAREKLHQNLSVIATKRDVHIILDYKTSFVRLIGIVENVKNARTDILLYIDSLVNARMNL
jgi:hypothetical protein